MKDMQKKLSSTGLALVLVAALLMSFPLVSAPPPDKCEPWPECKDGGEEPPADPAIAYRIGYSIWVMNADGSNQAVVLDEAEYPGFRVFGQLSWSPDGASLAFGGRTDGTWGLFILDITVVDGVPQGGGFRQIVSDEDCNSCYHPAWSPTGDEIAVERNPNFVGPRTIFVVSPEGGPVETIYSLPYGVGALRSATWNSDGTRLAFWEHAYSVYSIKILERASGIVTHVLVEGQFTAPGDLDWARQGVDTLAFAHEAESPTRTYTVDIDTGEVTSLVDGSTPSWSPDNSKLALMTMKGQRQHHISSYDIASGELTQLARGGSGPDWKR
jgi:Tol biopolymer transport system component